MFSTYYQNPAHNLEIYEKHTKSALKHPEMALKRLKTLEFEGNPDHLLENRKNRKKFALKSHAKHSRAALNLLNDFLMRTCVPINARRKISLNRPNYEECEIILHSACVPPLGRLRLKSSLSSGYVLRVFCAFVYKIGSFGGHEVNGFVDVCASTNILVGWSGKNP